MNINFLNKQILIEFDAQYKDYRENLSAVMLDPDRYLWLATDETLSLERFSAINESTFGNHQSFSVANYIDLPNPSEGEIDIEGMDYSDHYLWFVGSHSLKRKKVKSGQSDLEKIEALATIENDPNRYLLGRIPLVNGNLGKVLKHPQNDRIDLTAAYLVEKRKDDKGNRLINALRKDIHIGPFLSANIPSKDNGFDIEGLAIYQNRIFLGLRGPVLRGWAVILEVEIVEINPTQFKLRKQAGKIYKKHFVDLKGLGVRDLCFRGQDLLIMAGPTMDLDGPVKLFQLPNAINLPENSLIKPQHLLDIPYGNQVDHAEGITLVSLPENPRLLVVYDSPAEESRLDRNNGVLADIFQLEK